MPRDLPKLMTRFELLKTHASRRSFLARSAGGIGSVALAALLNRTAAAAPTSKASPSGWPAAGSRGASRTARPTTSVTTPSRKIVPVHDLHATMMQLLGIDHKRLTVKAQGRDFRLTDVFGNVVKDILA